MDLRRDTSFDIVMANRNVGINIVDGLSKNVKELVVKHMNEESKSIEEEP
jgi:hypothetical protein